MKKLTFIATILVIVSSCERDAHIDIPPQVPKLVTESEQGQNVFPEARIVHTRGVTDPLPPYGSADPYIVRNAVVLLYENDVFKDSLKYKASEDIYKAAIAKIQAGQTYKLVFSAPNYPTAEAISVTPTLVPINNMVFTPDAKTDADGNQQDEVKITFTDNGSTEDYYLVRLFDAYGGYLYCVKTNDKDVEKLVEEDPLYPEDCMQSDRLLLSDQNFNGATKTLILYVQAGSLDPVTSPSVNQKARIELLHINKDYFKYFKSLNNYENAADNPFAEPVNLFTNVKNGYGFFTTYAMAVDSIP